MLTVNLAAFLAGLHLLKNPSLLRQRRDVLNQCQLMSEVYVPNFLLMIKVVGLVNVNWADVEGL